MSPITSHVLDTALGRPARALKIELARLAADGSWALLAERLTNDDGRVTDLLPAGALERATYRVRFDTGRYFEAGGRASFYPYVDVVFTAEAAEHYHVPLLLSPFGYSTYRGS